MNETPRVLSDEQIDKLMSAPTPEGGTIDEVLRMQGRAIESATLKAVSGQEPLPEGWRLIAVNAEFDNLMYWMDRCESKGHLENCYDLVEPWAAFQYLEHTPPAQPSPVDGALRSIQKKMADFIHLANHVGINDADGFYLAHAIEVEEQARAALSQIKGQA